MRGLPKSYIKKYGISKKAWAEYRKAKGGRKRKVNKPKKTRNITRRIRSVAKKRRSRRGGNLQATVFKWLRITALALPAVRAAAVPKAWQDKVTDIVELYSGYNAYYKTFKWESLAAGWAPFVVTSLITAAIPKIRGIISRI